MDDLYTKYATDFADWAEDNPISVSAQGLYYCLLYQFAKLRFPAELHISNAKLMELTGAKSNHPIDNWRKELIAAHIIDTIPGQKGKETRYRLIDIAENAHSIEKSAYSKAENAQLQAENAHFVLSLNNINNNISDNKPKYHKYGEYGWVKLTNEQYNKLLEDLGQAELDRCIAYIDESAQSTGNKNKWKDWNLMIRKCSRLNWGYPKGQEPVSPSIWEPLPDIIPDYTMREGDLL